MRFLVILALYKSHSEIRVSYYQEGATHRNLIIQTSANLVQTHSFAKVLLHA